MMMENLQDIQARLIIALLEECVRDKRGGNVSNSFSFVITDSTTQLCI